MFTVVGLCNASALLVGAEDVGSCTDTLLLGGSCVQTPELWYSCTISQCKWNGTAPELISGVCRPMGIIAP